MKNRLTQFCILIILTSPLISNGNFLAYPNENNSDFSLNSIDYSNWFWTDIEVLTGGDDSSYNVEMAIDESNNIHIVWQDDTDDLEGSGTDMDIFYMNWDFVTETWSSVEVVSTESSVLSDESILAIDSNGNVHVVWTDFADILGAGTDCDVFYRKRSSSGTWSSSTLLSDLSDSLVQELSIEIDSLDNIYVVWSDPTDVGDLGGADRDIFYNIYDDHTSTWSGMTLITTDSSSTSLEPWLAIDSKDFVHLVWTDSTDMYTAGTDYDIFYKKFLSSLDTWSTTQLVSTESTLESRDCHIDLDSEDSVHVVWHDETNYQDSGFDYDIFYKFCESSQSGWTTTEVISIYSDVYSALPKIAIDKDDTLHLVWEDLEDYGGYGSDWDVVYQYKEKDSNIWSQLIVFSHDPDDISYEPRVLVDNLNHLHFIWYDNTDYLGSGVDYDVFYRKFVGPPEATILSPFDKDNIEIGNLTLTWQAITGAEQYEVYRENSYLDSYSALTPITVLDNTQYTDTLNETGDYYYSVLVTNRFGESDLSNVESITVVDTSEQQGLFGTFNLSEILILASILGGFQIIIAAIVISLSRVFSSQPRSGKKK